MPIDLNTEIQIMLAEIEAKVEQTMKRGIEARSPEEFRAAELEMARHTREFSDRLMEVALHERLADSGFQALALAAAHSGETKYRSGGQRPVTVTLLGGRETSVKVAYLKPDRRGKPGRKRKTGRRGKGGVGLYPCLAVLGIWFGVTPALAGEICYQAASSDSIRAAREALDRRGIDLGHKQTLRIVNHMAKRAVEQRNEWLHVVRERGSTANRGFLRGKRVVVAPDGGRVRIRIPHTRGRRRKSGHRGFKSPWQEPKLSVIYVIGADGRIEHSFRPVCDGTLGDADALFEMLSSYLLALGAQEAAQLIIIGDGAPWIWNRASGLATNLGLDKVKVEVIDKCHAIENLFKIVAIPTRWPKGGKRRWTGKAKRHLCGGRIEALIQMIHELADTCFEQEKAEILSHVPYFDNNRHRMRYCTFRARRIPIGSGAIESAIRRVINLRLKSNAKFWLAENAEGMLLLRSYLKVGRFDDLIDWSFAAAVTWWEDVSWYGPIAFECYDVTLVDAAAAA
ncbi:MAG: hypothetical protein KJ638_00380 [Chloroflexi bacterium]|nr:hypothetical protein [Chloroflexota bacterium]